MAVPMSLIRLMQRCKINWRWKLLPEQKLAIECADMLRAVTLDGSYQGVWYVVPNEGKRSKIVAIILKAMGLLSGVLDYTLMGPWGHGCIELKVPPNGLTDSQKDFIQWLDRWNIPHRVCTSPDAFMSTLKEWGALL